VKVLAYFKIGNTDYSKYVNKLAVEKIHQYNAQTNAKGDSVVDYINFKRSISVGIIPLDDAAMRELQTQIKQFNLLITFRNPETGELENNVNCILPESEIEYYTIQQNKVRYNAFELTFTEL
jgi:hypothetical protein